MRNTIETRPDEVLRRPAGPHRLCRKLRILPQTRQSARDGGTHVLFGQGSGRMTADAWQGPLL